MKLKNLLALLLCMALLCGCTPAQVPGESNDGTQDTTGDQQGSGETIVSTVIDPENAFSKRDLRDTYDESECVKISLEGDTASCDGEGVTVSGSTVTITAAGSYLLSGRLKGMVIVEATKDDKIQLILAGAQIESATSAAIYVKKADKVFVTTAAGTENTVKNSGEFVAIDDNNIDAAIYAKDDLTLNGQGKLTVASSAGHGIVSKDDLVIGSGEYDITCTGHGLAGKDSVRIAAGTIKIDAGKDAIHSENDDDTAKGYVYLADGTFGLTADGDGISASNSMRIDGGSYVIASGGGSENGNKDHTDNFGGGRPGGWFGGSNSSADTSSDTTSMKGIKSAGDMTITGGSFHINAADDGVHTNSSMTISGGNFEITTGDDGFHADDSLTFSDGTVNITTSYEGLEALHLTISGGEIKLVATDDGLNAAGGTDNSGFGGGDMGNMGDVPEMPNGDPNGMGDAPEIPTGGMGDAPEMPTGERPDQGDIPGGMGQMPGMPGGQGDMGQIPGDSGNQDGVSELSNDDTDGVILGKLGGFPGGMGGGFGGMGGMGGMSSSDGTIVISGGDIYIQASGDGIDANGTLEITGGRITICGPNSGDTASLDFDLTGTISGGTVIATGASGMAQTFSSAQQGMINYRAGNQKAGTQVTLKDSNGNVILSVTPALDYSMIILSSPDLKSGETYTLTIGTTSKQVMAS